MFVESSKYIFSTVDISSLGETCTANTYPKVTWLFLQGLRWAGSSCMTYLAVSIPCFTNGSSCLPIATTRHLHASRTSTLIFLGTLYEYVRRFWDYEKYIVVTYLCIHEFIHSQNICAALNWKFCDIQYLWYCWVYSIENKHGHIKITLKITWM